MWDKPARAWRITTGMDVVIFLSGYGFITSSQMTANLVEFVPVPIWSTEAHVDLLHQLMHISIVLICCINLLHESMYKYMYESMHRSIVSINTINILH